MTMTAEKVFKFEELSKEAKENAIENYRKNNYDDDFWSECILEDWKEKLEKKGYENVEIFYSGFSCQGDGACFIASVNLSKWIKSHRKSKMFSEVLKHINNGGFASVKIEHQSRYYYASSTIINDELENPEEETDEFRKILGELSKSNIDYQWTDLVKLITEERENLGNEIYRALENAWDYEQSEEAITETILANEYEFDKDGERI